ncbi:BRO1-like domain-containing protein [Chytriomyces sp. MP71]|nr:BRO1-like domain-containing protein [Chytriomyces sp. MP71]
MEGSNTTLTGAPISFHHLYEAATPQHIPFNLGPNFNADVQKFLFIPTKRNAPFRTNRHDLAQGNVVNRALAALRGSPSAGNVNEAAAQDHAIFLDFERFLMPVINEALASDAHLGARWAPGDSGSLQRCDTVSEFGVSRRPVEDFRKTKALVPSQSQWAHLNSLRMHSGSPERSEVGIKKLTEYYAQLVFINHKFDLNAKKMHQSFGWYEAFSTERLVLSPCIHFEMAAVLYNIAAIYSQLACTQPLWSIHGKKLAADYFKKSAGIFIYLRDTHSQRIQVRLDKTSDLTETSLNAAAQIMSAQAMECYFDKANEDKKSSPVMSKISAQTADFFDLAVKFSKEGLNVLSKQRFPKIWLHQLTAKTYLYAAIAHLHAPLLLVAEQALGERVARLSVSKTLAHRALKSSKDAGGSVHEIVKAYVDSIQSSYSLAEAANFEKHHHPHIDVSLASSLARPAQTLVHPIPGSETLGDLSMFTDFFAAYKPLEIDADLSCLATYAVQVVEGATRELETSKTEIER